MPKQLFILLSILAVVTITKCQLPVVTDFTAWCNLAIGANPPGGAEGRFPDPNDVGNPKLCKNYVFCYYHDGIIKGHLYTCVGSMLFDRTIQKCRVTAMLLC
jgi:hypothetical protein